MIETISNKKTSGVTKNRSTMVHSAILFTPPDLTFYISLQNSISFCLDCAVQFSATGTIKRDDNFFRCIAQLEDIRHSKSNQLASELNRLFLELFEEADSIKNLLSCFCDDTTNKKETPLMHVLAAKSSRIQWLSVCMLEELKNQFQFFALNSPR